MTNFGEYFCNTTQFTTGDPWLVGRESDIQPTLSTVPAARTNTQNLNRILSLMVPTSRWVLYFPPGIYLIPAKSRTPSPDLVGNIYPDLARQVEDPDVRIPANVTLMMAAGAVLQLDPGVVLRIDGLLEAPVAKIFDFVPSANLDERGTSRSGRVVFFSDDVPELYPEWWGAYNNIDHNADMPDGLPSRASNALQRCFHAAHRDRVWPDWFKPSIPVLLQGTYALEREVVLDDDSGPGGPLRNPQGIIVRGRRGPATANGGYEPNLTPHRDYAWPSGAPSLHGRALLRVQDVNGCVFEGIGFSSNNQTYACVQVAGRARQNTFRECAFKCSFSTMNVTRQLVQLGDYLSVTADTPLEGCTGAHDLTGTSFEACYFDTGSGTPTDTSDVRAVVMHAWNSMPMRFLACQFRGSTVAYIEAAGGAFLLQDTTFHNAQVRTSHLDPTRNLTGMDIYLREPPARPSERFRLPSFVASRVMSQSYQFLNTFRDAARSRQHLEPLAVILDGITHDSANLDVFVTVTIPSDPPLVEETPAAIEWQGPGMPRDMDLRGTPLGDMDLRVAPLVIVGSVFNVNRHRWIMKPGMDMLRGGLIGLHEACRGVFEVGSRSAVGGWLMYTFTRRDSDGWPANVVPIPHQRDPAHLEAFPQVKRLA